VAKTATLVTGSKVKGQGYRQGTLVESYSSPVVCGELLERITAGSITTCAVICDLSM